MSVYISEFRDGEAVVSRLDSGEKTLRALAEGEAPEGYGLVYYFSTEFEL